MVGKKKDEIYSDNFYVDKWKVIHRENNEGGNDLVETFEGKIKMEKVDEKKYLGHILSNRNNNMANINYIKIKSRIITSKIFNMLDTLQLGRYYFECGIVFLRSLLRSSIIYSAETYYNLTEAEVREMEKMEESYLLQLYNTETGCPRSQLYLESGVYPLRFEVMKMKIMFLHYIVNEDSHSLISQFYTTQRNFPQKGDWASQTDEICDYLDIKYKQGEFKLMSKQKLKSTLKKKIESEAFEYLLGLRISKGKEIDYKRLEMSDYLLPNKSKLSNDDKKYLFSIRNRMIRINSNFYGQKEKENLCPSECGKFENMLHIYECQILNENTNNHLQYEKIYNGTLVEKIQIYKRMKKNIERRNFYEEKKKM